MHTPPGARWCNTIQADLLNFLHERHDCDARQGAVKGRHLRCTANFLAQSVSILALTAYALTKSHAVMPAHQAQSVTVWHEPKQVAYCCCLWGAQSAILQLVACQVNSPLAHCHG